MSDAPVTADGNGGFTFQLTDWLMQQPPNPPQLGETSPAPSRESAEFAQSIFRDAGRRSLIAEYRRGPLTGPGNELVLGREGWFRVTTDGGSLLGKSAYAPSISVQRRTPIVTDPRVRSARYGRLLASGSYWAPAREDLDTMLSKIDSRLIRDVIVVKGPYTSRLGPGYSFIDFQFVETPRYDCGPRLFTSSSLVYKTNGGQWNGRQDVWGGGSDWGFRAGYGHRTGSDYSTGSSAFDADGTIPSSYQSRQANFSLGKDLTCDSRLEFSYLRLDQTDVEFPGLIFDINALQTDGLEVTYSLWDQPNFDLLTVDGWYNRTAFTGDTSRSGKNRQIPSIRPNFDLDDDQYLVTDVDGMSAGYRAAVTWGQDECPQLTVGTDLIQIGQQLNDIVPPTLQSIPFPPFEIMSPAQNFPIPRSHSTDVGLFAEHIRPYCNGLTIRTGTRVDLISTDAREYVPGMGVLEGFPPELVEKSLSELKHAQLDQEFYPWAVFATAEYELNPCWTLMGGAGYAMRTPTLTELYAAGSFIGSLQPGLTFLEGDPELDSERAVQLDLGIRFDTEPSRLSLNGFVAWIHDYVTYDDIAERYQSPAPAYVPGTDLQHVAYVNTDLAFLTGFEVLGEQDLASWLTGFVLASYVQGRDLARNDPSRIASIIRDDAGFPIDTPRSFVDGVPEEWLPGIPPLEARVGLRFHQPCLDPSWGVEIEARMVDRQDLVATTLSERETSGFTILNARGYARPADNFMVYAGVENFTDRFYREHLDYRAGRGVWQPGVNFYFSGELTY